MAERIFRRFTFKSLLLWALGLIGVALLLAYGGFEARRIIEGPQITLTSPQDGSAVGGPTVTIAGQIENADFFTINGRQVLSDENGNFSDILSPTPGLAVIQVAARDRFGRVRVKNVEINVLAECIEEKKL